MFPYSIRSCSAVWFVVDDVYPMNKSIVIHFTASSDENKTFVKELRNIVDTEQKET